MSSLHEQIKSDLGYLKLDAAAGSFAALADQARTQDWTHTEFLARLVAVQATADRDRRLAARMRHARFPFHRRIADFDFDFQPSIDAKLAADLATLRFIDEQRPILFPGQPGCGKTHLAAALAIAAVEAGYRGYFTTADNIVKTLTRADHDGNAATKIKAYTAPTVLVIDDVGLIRLKTPADAAWFFEIVNTRYEKSHPTLVTTNPDLPDWDDIIGDTAAAAAAILDRLTHNAVVFNIHGPSWRPKEHDSLQIATTQPTQRSHRQPHPAKPATPHPTAKSAEHTPQHSPSAHNVCGARSRVWAACVGWAAMDHRSYRSRPRERSPSRSPLAARRCSASSLLTAVHHGRTHGSSKPPSSGNLPTQSGSPRRASSEFTSQVETNPWGSWSRVDSSFISARAAATESIVARIRFPTVAPQLTAESEAAHSATVRQARAARFGEPWLREAVSWVPSMSSENRRVIPHAIASELPPLNVHESTLGDPADW